MIELVIVLAVGVLGVTMFFKYREKPVDMNHKAPNVHNVVSETPNEPKPVAAPAPVKKVVKKTTTKKAATKKKATTKKTASKK